MSHTENHKTTTELLEPGAMLQSRYRIVGRLGMGGMGAVYEAIDLRLDHTVALKQILTSDETLWKQFEREARLMARLNHTALPRVSDYFTEGNRAFFVMQHVEGLDLAEMIAQQPGPFPQKSVVAWADQLLDALVYLHSHERQIVHRDIKPHNLRVTASGQIALLDFGLAKSQSALLSDVVTCTSVFGYTPRYAPLEQIQDLGTSPQSDIYALGATLYHLFTGVKPSDALTRAAALVSAKPNPLRPACEVNPAIGLELSDIIGRAMAQNPDERFASAQDFREALREIGRTDETSDRVTFEIGEFADSDFTVVVGDYEPSLPQAEQEVRRNRFGTQSIAAVFVILLASYGVFCNYYPWTLPAAAPAPATSASVIVPGIAQTSVDRHQNSTRKPSQAK